MLSPDQIRFAGWTAGIFLVGCLVIRGILPAWSTPHSDFSNYYVSARLIAKGSNLDSLYNNEWFHDQMMKEGVHAPGKFAPFPPITAWLMLPLTGFEPLNAQRVFMIVNVAFLFTCALGWKEVSGWKMGPSIVIVLAGGASVFNNIAFGQVYLIITALMMWSIVWMRNQWPLAAGVTFGILAVLKYFPVAPLAGLGLAALFGPDGKINSAWRVVGWSLVTIALLIVIQLAFFGPRVMNDYFTTAFLPHLGSDLSGQGMYSFPFQSWDSLARNLFVYDAVANPQPLIHWPAGRNLLKILVAIIVGSAGLLAMYRIRLIGAGPLEAGGRRPSAEIFMAVVSLAVLVVLPASATYHFVMLLLPLGLLIGNRILPQRIATVAIGLYVLIGFIPYGWFVGLADRLGLIFAYPRLWLITLLFAVVAVTLIRNRSEHMTE
jgi:hypothetical protein